MTGCPYGLVYSAEQTLRELQRDSNFSYQPGVIVSHFREKRGVAEIVATQYGEKTRYSAEKVLVAMGVWSSTRAMLQSLGRTEASIKDSQYIIIPCLVAKRGSKGRQHALSQLFIEYCDAELGNVHLQFYPFSDLVEQGVADKLGLFYRAFGIFLRPLVQRLVVVQAFLHSDVSGSLAASLTDSGLSVEGKACKNRKRLPRMLQRHAAKLGLFPLLPLVEYCLPGQGFHSGGSFPMSDRPQDGESDLLGRCGFENIHLVDSSILPGIAGTTITLTEMANAHRIADTLSRGPSQPESEAGKQKPS
jgi:choline dehydrogenase-like flavoprotein